MQNFNTYQTRQFYVAGAINDNVNVPGETVAPLDIAVKKTANGELFFSYLNADGILTRSDTFDPKKIVSLKKTTADKMARPLMAHKISVDANAVTLGASSPLIGKTLDCIITMHGVFDYDDANTYTFVASVVGNATNTATAAAFHKDLAMAIAKALPVPDKLYPLVRVYSNGSEVTAKTAASSVNGAAGGVVLVPGLQKYVRGKLTGEPINISVAFRLADGNYGDIVWGKDDDTKTVAQVNTADTSSISPAVYPANYILADLEYFALGERGDMYRGFNWPHNYDTTYSINPNSGTYSVLTIEYYWQGGAENVQKSPRMIQVAAPETVSNDIVSELYDTIDAAIAGASS